MTSFAIIAALSITLFIVLIFYWLNKLDTKELKREKQLLQSKEKKHQEALVTIKNMDFTNHSLKTHIAENKQEMMQLRQQHSDNIKLIARFDKIQGEQRKQISQLAEQLHASESRLEILKEEFEQVVKEKTSAVNKMSTAWRQVQEWKTDESGKERTLTGAIDAGLDAKDSKIKELEEKIADLTIKVQARGGRTQFKKK